MECEAAETLMSLSAPNDARFTARMGYWRTQVAKRKKKNQQDFQLSPNGTATASIIAMSLPANSTHWERKHAQFPQEMPWKTAMKYSDQDGMLKSHCMDETASSSSSDMLSPGRFRNGSDELELTPSEEELMGIREEAKSLHRVTTGSLLDDLCAAAAQDDGKWASQKRASSISKPIFIPRISDTQSKGYYKHSKLNCTRLAKELGAEMFPSESDDDGHLYESYHQSPDFRQRLRLASVGSSDTGSEYGGLGRRHLEEFNRMEISAFTDNDSRKSTFKATSDQFHSKCIGNYSPSARKKRIERFLEKRKHRVWSKKVDYDVRKVFANSRLRVKGRFVKKEDEELLCKLLSMT
uniref:Uncharacterized protein AlNc14C363G11023 n=1 Tax=Albugo laibachii Nc14 TaxID=890382 RepID=F0WXT6_9STRA|nr:conserved hypothetical protein [Albugo laibachii Nc14]|eukprot:CCA26284.1 conserved hypothetical protein [Albugo laibachii Nc14]